MISAILAAAAFLGSLQPADALVITRAEITAEQIHRDLNTPPCLVLSYGIMHEQVYEQEMFYFATGKVSIEKLRATILRVWAPKTLRTDGEWDRLAGELSPAFSIIRDLQWSRRPATP
jgi:hypothetical protein